MEHTRWYKDLVFYQIWPRSFYDGDGDGMGDLWGVYEKLDYLKSLGMDGIWFSPLYPSPGADCGYDISDYMDIAPEYGGMEAFQKVLQGAHDRGMKVIMDLVVNHTSDEHPWFQKSRRREDPYTDYYIWRPGKKNGKLPNNWDSCFEGKAWQYDEVRGEYYMHIFAVKQPDLNMDNPLVRQEVKKILRFWLDLGVDGFRVDVIDQISKDFEAGRNCFGPRLHEFIHALFGREKTAKLFTVGECWVGDEEEMRRHCAMERGELSTLFQFDHMEIGRENKFTPKADTLKTLRDVLLRWQAQTARDDLLHSLFTDNHDQPPMISRAADDGEKRYESATCMAAMVYLLKGVPFIYQGQEIGMTAAHYDSIDDFDDIESRNAYREFCQSMTEAEAIEKINFGSRDNARRPMAWAGGEGCGFTTGRAWITPHSRCGEINLENDLKAEKSVFRFYQALLKLRREHDAFLDGEVEVISRPEDDCMIYTRTLGAEKWAVVCNFHHAQEIALPFRCGGAALSNLGRCEAAGLYAPYE